MTARRRFIGTLGALGAAHALALRSAAAQEWKPARPVTIIVPFPAGGLLDAIARRLGQRIGPALGSPIVVENRPGANTMIGAQAAARAAPDGHTLLFTTDASLTINPLVYKKVSYDAERDFAPVTLVANTVECLIANGRLPASNLKEFVALAKREGGKLNYGSYGLASNAHLGTEELQHHLGVQFNHVPYKGQGELYQALINNDIQFVIGTTGIALGHIQEGRLKVLAAFSDHRAPLFPNVPTAREQGVDMVGGAWFGFVAPAGTPPAAIQRLGQEILRAADDAEFRENQLIKLGLEPAAAGPEAMRKRLEADRARYKAIVDRLKLSLD